LRKNEVRFRTFSSVNENATDGPYCENKNIDNCYCCWIHTGGVWVAERLISAVPTTEPLATLDITFYRDDFTKAGLNPKVNQTSLPAIEDRHVILVDDVLMSGRTIRAAMNEILTLVDLLVLR